MKRNEFNYRREKKPNPYIGMTSFQHFCGDPLYTDSVIDPARNNVETEDFECYPVPDGIEEKGDEQGFYPYSTVAYFRVLWKDFEPERGVYNYDLIEKILRGAEARGQTVMLRLMPHSTCARDDVPDWLKTLIPCPERPAGARFKDSPTDPMFVKLFVDALRALAVRFDSDKTLDVVDISLVGAWGEGHRSDDFAPELIEYMFDTQTEYYKNTILLTQISRPMLTKRARDMGYNVGYRADAFGQPAHRDKWYPMFLADMPEDIWKSAPISAESFYWLGEWKRQGWSAKETFDYMISLHVSTFNGKYLPIPFEWRDEVQAFLDKMGYHFVIDSFEYDECVSAGKKLRAKIAIDNVGNAPIYHPVPLKIRLKSETDELTLNTGVDIREWLPGKHDAAVEMQLPDTLRCGKYSVEVAVTGDGWEDVYFCTDAESSGVWYRLGEVEVMK